MTEKEDKVEPQVISLEEFNKIKEDEKISSVAESTELSTESQEKQLSMREHFDELWFTKKKIAEKYVEIYNDAETATPKWDIIDNWNIKLKALDRISELSGHISKRWWDININLAQLLQK